MSDPYKGSNAKPQVATPHSTPVKLTNYKGDGPKQQVKPPTQDGNGGYSEKLPRKWK